MFLQPAHRWEVDLRSLSIVVSRLAWMAARCPKGHDWPSRTGKSRYKFWIFVALTAAIGVTWSLSDPVSQISLYDLVRRLLLGLIQGVSVAIAVLWRFNESRHDT
ncbi:hypothetical protein [Lentzea terrae]|uniref:hypothetical protein n=1 Tax=Lentzea terrae TaxID=2200761 RepID=UPI000DD4C09D|nr:hypothetical protein [Lentzea terrae]